MSSGSARTTFAVGALLTLPGASYLAGLDGIEKQNLSTAATVGLIVAFNVIMLMLLELPLLGYTFAPEKTERAVSRFSETLDRDGGRILLVILGLLGVALLARGITGLT